MLRLTAPLAIAVAIAAPALAQTAAEKNAVINAELPADQAALKSHVMFLASDAMAGREAGSHEFDIAAQYVAAQFYAAGLKPAGDEGSYLQKVPLVSYKLDGQGSMLVTRKGAAPVSLVFGEDYVPGANPSKPSFTISAPVVFVGYGITGLGRDDYKGADVKGKIVAFFNGAPKNITGEEGAHFSSSVSKGELAMKRGAVGYITIETPVATNARPFAAVAALSARPRFTWGEADGMGHIATPSTPGLGMLSDAGAAKLFEGAKTSWATIRKQAQVDGAKFKPVPLPGTLTYTVKTALTPVTSYNVAGLIPGSDPTLSKEVVVLSAHLDHIGIGRPDASGDTINNGALDDAVGIASLIEEAKRFKAGNTKPRRTILFLAVTAEEKGLLGSDYYAHHLTVPKGSIVADVNLDMPIITYKFEDIVVYGANHSTLGPIVERAAAEIGVKMSDDPLPGENIFVRSDHYNFVKQGVPSIFLWPGAGGPGRAAIDDFMKNHYHKPSDEVGQLGIDWESGVRFVDVNYRIARAIADGDQRPLWNKGDFFGTLFNGPGAR